MTDKLIEYQIKELELKKKEIELKSKVNDNNYEYAKETLKYQSEDFKEQRRKEIMKDKLGVMMVTMWILFFFLFLTIGMMLNKDELLKDVIKAVGLIFGGGITGYGLGVRATKGEKVK